MIAATTDALPDNTGYVAAAYIVFVVLVLIYVAVMAIRMARLERDIVELDELAKENASSGE